MRYCQGDYECPHCGADLYDGLQAWTRTLADAGLPPDAAERQIQAAIDALDELPPCSSCGMRHCQGDYECPFCGADLDDGLRAWAETTIDRLIGLGATQRRI